MSKEIRHVCGIDMASKKFDNKFVYFFETRNIEEFEPVCTSFVESVEVPFLEVDDFRWATPEIARKLLHYSQKHLINVQDNNENNKIRG